MAGHKIINDSMEGIPDSAYVVEMQPTGGRPVLDSWYDGKFEAQDQVMFIMMDGKTEAWVIDPRKATPATAGAEINN